MLDYDYFKTPNVDELNISLFLFSRALSVTNLPNGAEQLIVELTVLHVLYEKRNDQ